MVVWSQHASEKYLPQPSPENRLAICLAGSGFRAAVFHAGALRRINEFGWLAHAETIAGASAGALVAGLLGRRWSDLEEDDRGVLLGLESVLVEPIERQAGRSLGQGSVSWSKWQPRHWSKARHGDFNATD
ncbi:MAG: patatin-like phospholipase family protein, partial [Planctomycetia bacterium]